YKYTNNLRTHIETHDDVSLSAGNVGGRASQKIINKTIKFYKYLYSGVEPATAVYDPVSPSTTGASILPVLPVKKDRTVHVTNMRAAVAKMGYKILYKSCSTRTACYKDINLCNFFIFFDCGDMHPRAAIVEPEEKGETA
ncbi:hypothetical protein BO71DRAFT_326108, partial [Aspergillus ellipticus CBS 707.79]